VKKGVVFHIDVDNTWLLQLLIGNIKNYLPLAEGRRVCVVANGLAVSLFVKGCNPALEKELLSLAKSGVKFFLCNNAIKAKGIKPESILSFCEVVPAGIAKLVELQEEGFAYIKP